jgi:hypothetical protein
VLRFPFGVRTPNPQSDQAARDDVVSCYNLGMFESIVYSFSNTIMYFIMLEKGIFLEN